MKQLWTGLLFLALIFEVSAQTPPPNTDIYLFGLKERKGKISLSKAKNITNRQGYDNQPSFFNNDYILYSSYREGQNDIMIYDIYEDTHSNLSNSKDSEYSPTPIPGYNSYAVVRVEEDGSQRLWMYHMDKKQEAKVIFEKIMPVGYFAIQDKDVLMFVLGNPVTLVLANMEEVNDDIITSNVGRTIRSVPGTNEFTFERTEEDGSVMIYRLERVKNEFFEVIKKPEGASDWTISPEGTYYTSVGTKIMAYHPEHHSEWIEVTDLGNEASAGITRMAINQENDKLAVVINKP